MAHEWVVAEGWEPIPGIGPGPMSDAEFKQRIRAYLDRGWPGGRLPLSTVTKSGIYRDMTAGPHAWTHTLDPTSPPSERQLSDGLNSNDAPEAAEEE